MEKCDFSFPELIVVKLVGKTMSEARRKWGSPQSEHLTSVEWAMYWVSSRNAVGDTVYSELPALQLIDTYLQLFSVGPRRTWQWSELRVLCWSRQQRRAEISSVHGQKRQKRRI